MDEEIQAEIPATVAEVAVGTGDPVAAGDELMLLESMKMEIPVVSEVDGVVTAVDVVPADTVRAGDRIAVVSPREADPAAGTA
ncbi:biotin/lipoyl-binding carrier protein [Actinomycetospora sp. OC33-EN08]|uniref:Biotin/lipoyl-binding carrier protein n=1 Tax=Actinomycetospora aurantiaca TaxID=3129233 RepID=A0ABU8MTR1_9PSEU